MSDIPCRYGGEEFILILPNADIETTKMRAEKIRAEAAAGSIVYHRQDIGPITVSLGIAVFPKQAQTLESILKKADEALDLAKKLGRNRVEIAPDLWR
jgi:diguanylate cyclase (GGDEF)-like protein